MNCPRCKKLLVENLYHRAKRQGAVYWCGGCDSHITKDLRIIPKWKIRGGF